MIATVLSIIAVLTGLASLWFTDKQWQKVKKKIGMLSDTGKAIEILPTWYTERMMRDKWYFGLLMTNGSVIAISSIAAISEDGKWMDVELLTSDELPASTNKEFITAVSEDRRISSIQIDKIVTDL